ncbi:7156_t:CDS:2 [Entrophospora sp. SA101]|nr:7156_t:CDS:2 [Entrophospora sp. SA101]
MVYCRMGSGGQGGKRLGLKSLQPYDSPDNNNGGYNRSPRNRSKDLVQVLMIMIIEESATIRPKIPAIFKHPLDLILLEWFIPIFQKITDHTVAHIHHVSGGGTHSFSKMCHRGCMFAPIKIWHKWHVKTNLNQKIYVTVSLLAASSISDLVLTHGHRIEEVQKKLHW